MEKENKKIKPEEVTTINELAVMMRDAFQTNQDYMDKKFEVVDKKFEVMDRNFAEVKTEINKVNLNAVDVVRKEEFDKLESRVSDVEDVLDLKLKRA